MNIPCASANFPWSRNCTRWDFSMWRDFPRCSRDLGENCVCVKSGWKSRRRKKGKIVGNKEGFQQYKNKAIIVCWGIQWEVQEERELILVAKWAEWGGCWSEFCAFCGPMFIMKILGRCSQFSSLFCCLVSLTKVSWNLFGGLMGELMLGIFVGCCSISPVADDAFPEENTSCCGKREWSVVLFVRDDGGWGIMHRFIWESFQPDTEVQGGGVLVHGEEIFLHHHHGELHDAAADVVTAETVRQ